MPQLLGLHFVRDFEKGMASLMNSAPYMLDHAPATVTAGSKSSANAGRSQTAPPGSLVWIRLPDLTPGRAAAATPAEPSLAVAPHNQVSRRPNWPAKLAVIWRDLSWAYCWHPDRRPLTIFAMVIVVFGLFTMSARSRNEQPAAPTPAAEAPKWQPPAPGPAAVMEDYSGPALNAPVSAQTPETPTSVPLQPLEVQPWPAFPSTPSVPSSAGYRTGTVGGEDPSTTPPPGVAELERTIIVHPPVEANYEFPGPSLY
jgi:hypothetical protein